MPHRRCCWLLRPRHLLWREEGEGHLWSRWRMVSAANFGIVWPSLLLTFLFLHCRSPWSFPTLWSASAGRHRGEKTSAGPRGLVCRCFQDKVLYGSIRPTLPSLTTTTSTRRLDHHHHPHHHPQPLLKHRLQRLHLSDKYLCCCVSDLDTLCNLCFCFPLQTSLSLWSTSSKLCGSSSSSLSDSSAADGDLEDDCLVAISLLKTSKMAEWMDDGASRG